MTATTRRVDAIRRARRFVGEVVPLEGRALLSIANLTVEASPNRLFHPNPQNQPRPLPSGRFFPVTIAGDFDTNGTSAPVVGYQVIDEQHHDMTTGTIQPMSIPLRSRPNYFIYNKRIGLILARNPHDPDGRQYTIIVTAQDATGAQVATTVVIVPHRVFPFVKHPRVIHPR